MRRFKTSIFTALVMLVLGAASAACDQGVELATEQSTPSATASQEEGAPSQSAPAEDSGQAAEGSVDGIPYYQPSTLVSQSTGSIVLGTKDSIREVAAFYADVVDTGDWTVVSRAVAPDGAAFTIKKSGKGASIAVGSGIGGWPTAISISTYTSW
jgi:hypothetical protein